jgi:hypothetical protein
LSQNLNKKTSLLFIWFLIAPLPSAVTTGTPHPVRAIGMMIPLHIFTASGVIISFLKILNLKLRISNFRIVVSGLLVSLFCLNFIYYLHQYYVHTPIEYGDFWQYGYKEAFVIAKQYEGQVAKIIMTYHYDQPYIYYLFYNQVDPVWYQKNWDFLGNKQIERFHRVIGKYEFKNIDWPRDSKNKNTLIIGAPQEIPSNANVIHEVKFLDGSTAFRIAKT